MNIKGYVSWFGQEEVYAGKSNGPTDRRQNGSTFYQNFPLLLPGNSKCQMQSLVHEIFDQS